jgi:hypothetical protein
VESLKRIFLFLFAVAFVLSFDLRAFADEGHSHDAKMDHETMNKDEMKMNHEGMDMEHSSGSDMEGMDMDGGNQNHHGQVVESPPNYKVLGTYGAVNLLFILIGIWNKWFKRKGDVNNGHA